MKNGNRPSNLQNTMLNPMVSNNITFERLGYKITRYDNSFHIYEKPKCKFVFNLVHCTYLKDSECHEAISLLENAAANNKIRELGWLP